ncbi:glycoside hydrolase family 25 protein [Dactylosporangium sp. NPDC048998]|uniref:glycoside hydrolase family 25 protein n=1 Tax=Dactylosporangium sp. NPDC048998 TaxID=3363976 RepID=UPI00371E142F
MAVFGWDASDFDWDRGPMDLGAARAAGIDFFTHKATEGIGTRHRHYGEALARARAAGVPFLGAYHVVRSTSSVAAQVDFCLAYVDAKTPWWREHPGWFFQCDLEHWPYDKVAPSVGVAWCERMEARTGRRVLLYAPRWAYGDTIGGGAPLWASNYVPGRGGFRELYPNDTSTRWRPYSGRTPVILQYSSNATIGRQPTCDANAFRGTVADFARLIGAEPDGLRAVGQAGTQAEARGDNDMAIIAKDAGGQHYLCFLGGFRSFPIQADKIGDIKYLASQGAFALAHGVDGEEWEGGGWIRKGWSPEIFGAVAQ